MKEKARKYHLSYKTKEEEVSGRKNLHVKDTADPRVKKQDKFLTFTKNAQVSLVEGQKEAYKVPQEYGVAKFDPVR